MTTRYGLYLAPHAHAALWHFGSGVLGYDAQTGQAVEQIVPRGVDPDAFRALTQQPRRYGFHATLKAPFHLAPGRHREDLVAALERFCEDRAAFALPRLEVRALGADAQGAAFVALVEPEPTPELQALERETVLAFEPLRAPLAPEEIARRSPERLSPRQRDYLMRYGYPLVLEEFRFHMTLTGRVPAAQRDAIVAGLAEAYAAAVPEPGLLVDQIAIVEQDGDAPFRVTQRVLFV